jgi:uncharacterized protein (DUF302 family)
MSEIPVAGLTTIASSFGPSETVGRIQTEIRGQGLTVFATIDHAAGAADAGLTLRPTTLLIFGNARGGTPLMQASQTVGIDLPLKALVWQDAMGKTWVSYNEPGWMVQRHGLDVTTGIVDKLSSGLSSIVTKTTNTP